MKKNKKDAVTTQSQQKGRRFVRCMTCLHSLLHRYGNNPVLAACLKKPQDYNERFPYEVEVANCLRNCSFFEETTVGKDIEQRENAA